MAIEDYFKGSSQAYGQLAGSLLAGRRKEDKKEAKRALLASVVMNTFGALQNKQKQSIIDGVNDINEKYSDIFEGNKEYFNEKNISEQRKLYQVYKNEDTRERALLTQAINTFNQDEEILATYGPNAFTTVTQMKKSKEGADALAEQIELLKEQARDYFENISDEAITSPTFTNYNSKAKLAYQSAIKEVKNDPTKKGLIRAAWLKLFGRDSEGNPKFGLVYQDQLKDARETAESIAGIASSKDVERVKNLTEEIVKKEKIEKEKIKTDYGRIDKKPKMINRQREILFEAIDPKKQTKSFLNKDTYTFNINGKKQEGDVYDYYKELKTPDEQLRFLENILTFSSSNTLDYETTDTTGQIKSDTRFVREALSEYFASTLNLENPNLKDFNGLDNKLFDLNDTIEVTLGGETINVQIGNLANNFSNQKDKNVALQIIKDINDSVDNPAVINHFNNIFNKNFGVDEDDFDMSSFFEYEKKFKKNPLSI